jgi:hypothetical protein
VRDLRSMVEQQLIYTVLYSTLSPVIYLNGGFNYHRPN